MVKNEPVGFNFSIKTQAENGNALIPPALQPLHLFATPQVGVGSQRPGVSNDRRPDRQKAPFSPTSLLIAIAEQRAKVFT